VTSSWPGENVRSTVRFAYFERSATRARMRSRASRRLYKSGKWPLGPHSSAVSFQCRITPYSPKKKSWL